MPLAVAAGNVLIRKNAAERTLYFVASGELEVSAIVAGDALAPLARIAPTNGIATDDQRVDAVRVRRLVEPMPPYEPADVVVEAFAGGLPPGYVEAMAMRTPPPRWFRLEYLALEPSLDTHHALPSPHPQLALARTFWFPGFSHRTGGLLRERGLLAARDAFASDPAAADAFLASLGVPPRRPGELRVSMFCYPHAPLEALLDAWNRAATPVTCVVPHGVAEQSVMRFLHRVRAGPDGASRARVRIAAIPWVEQDAYDRLLWSCDVNFVRGEDSFVRAQWAAKPFVWNAYPQAGDAHAAKIEAFVDRYVAGLQGAPATVARALFSSWNALRGAPSVHVAWREYEGHLNALRTWSGRWARTLATLPELASALVTAAENRL